jgi:hypothetical protein
VTIQRLKIQVIRIMRVSRPDGGDPERSGYGGEGYEFCGRRDVRGPNQGDERHESELPELEAEQRLAAVLRGQRLRPPGEKQPEDHDEEQDGGHKEKIGYAGRPLHPWAV